MTTIVIMTCSLAIGLFWILLPLIAVNRERKLRLLEPQGNEVPSRWPRVSILVPARDEVTTLEASMASLLALDYPDLEIILIDDRSSDGTTELVDRLAQEDARIRPLHIDRLPAGWLGKVHALHRGLEICRGEWLLFTDADVHFAPQTLRMAIGHCMIQNKDFLSLLPRLREGAALVGAAQAAIGTLLLALMDSERIADPDSQRAMGVGAFNLARRQFLDAENGLEWLRMEVADDVGLALLMKQRGADIDLLSGRDLVEVDWYPSLDAMLDGVMQRMWIGACYSPWRYALQCGLLWLCLTAPLLLAIALSSSTPLAWCIVSFYAIPSVILGIGLRRFPIPGRLLWLWPAGALLIGYGMLRALFTVWRRGGLYWRRSIYTLRDLRAGQRVRTDSFTNR